MFCIFWCLCVQTKKTFARRSNGPQVLRETNGRPNLLFSFLGSWRRKKKVLFGTNYVGWGWMVPFLSKIFGKFTLKVPNLWFSEVFESQICGVGGFKSFGHLSQKNDFLRLPLLSFPTDFHQMVQNGQLRTKIGQSVFSSPKRNRVKVDMLLSLSFSLPLPLLPV